MSPDQVEKVQHCSVEDFWLIEIGSVTGMIDLEHPTVVQILKVLSRVNAQARVSVAVNDQCRHLNEQMSISEIGMGFKKKTTVVQAFASGL